MNIEHPPQVTFASLRQRNGQARVQCGASAPSYYKQTKLSLIETPTLVPFPSLIILPASEDTFIVAMSTSKNHAVTQTKQVDHSSGSFVEEKKSPVINHEGDDTANGHQQQQQPKQKLATPQKPDFSSVEKLRIDTTPELPVFKSLTHRTLEFEPRTPRASATVYSPSDDQ